MRTEGGYYVAPLRKCVRCDRLLHSDQFSKPRARICDECRAKGSGRG